MEDETFQFLYLIETFEHDVVGRDDVDHEVLWHRLDLEVQGDKEFLVQGGMRFDVGTVRKDSENKIKCAFL